MSEQCEILARLLDQPNEKRDMCKWDDKLGEGNMYRC